MGIRKRLFGRRKKRSDSNSLTTRKRHWVEIDQDLNIADVDITKKRAGHSTIDTGYSTLLLEDEIKANTEKATSIINSTKKRLKIDC